MQNFINEIPSEAIPVPPLDSQLVTNAVVY